LKKRTSLTETESEFEDAAVISVGDEDSVFKDLAASSAEIRKLKGVLGYILRNNRSAIVDFEEQEKISEFALLSTCIHDSSVEMVKPFNMSNFESVLVEGKDANVICFTLGENRLDVLIEKSTPETLITELIRS
jgi:hypothetical protein